MLPVKYVVYLLFLLHFLSIITAASVFLSVERPVVQLMNPKYVQYFNITSRRFGRRSPVYYVDMHVTTLEVIDNNFVFDIYFLEYNFNNQYRRSFLELHFKWCNMFLNDIFIGSALRKTLPLKCPHPPGSYHLQNLTLNADAIPPGFPFTKGRLLVNGSLHGEPVASAYADLELKINKKP